MKKILLIVLAFFLCFPIHSFALSETYSDRISKFTETDVKENRINLYLFYGEECPHCEEERKWLKQIEKDYEDYIDIYYFEVWHNKRNATVKEQVQTEFGITKNSVPLTIVGNDYFIGFSDAISSKIENKIKEYSELDNNPNEIKIPILGTINIKNVSIPFVAIILGFIDGFNPCAMWILLFLINMLFGIKNKKESVDTWTKLSFDIRICIFFINDWN